MRNAKFTLLLASLISSLALAQEANPYDGRWQASFESKKGVGREGTVVIAGKEGTWEILNKKKNNPCAGRSMPIAIERVTKEELVFTINRSKTLTGCKDSIANFKRADDKTLEGEFDGGHRVTLTRE